MLNVMTVGFAMTARNGTRRGALVHHARPIIPVTFLQRDAAAGLVAFRVGSAFALQLTSSTFNSFGAWRAASVEQRVLRTSGVFEAD
jgi:hypothetical protein